VRELAIGTIATSLVRKEEGACLRTVACSVGELVSLAHDDIGVAMVDQLMDGRIEDYG